MERLAHEIQKARRCAAALRARQNPTPCYMHIAGIMGGLLDQYAIHGCRFPLPLGSGWHERAADALERAATAVEQELCVAD